MGISAAIAASAAAGLAGSAISASGASGAAKTAAGAANQAALYNQQQYIANDSHLQPFYSAGQNIMGSLSTQYQNTQTNLNNAYNNLLAATPVAPTEDNLAKMPGYQFELDQGTKATQNSAAAQGLGVSGAALKGAANYAQGLAGTDLNNYMNAQYGIYNANSTNYTNQLAGQNAIYNQILGVASLGENAAAQSGNQGAALSTATGNNLTQAGIAGSQAQLSGANSIANGISNLGNSGLSYLALQNALNSNNDPYASGGAAKDAATAATPDMSGWTDV